MSFLPAVSTIQTHAQLYLISFLIKINSTRYIPTLVFRHRLLPLIHYSDSYTTPFLLFLHRPNHTFQLCFVLQIFSIPSCSHAHIAACSKKKSPGFISNTCLKLRTYSIMIFVWMGTQYILIRICLPGLQACQSSSIITTGTFPLLRAPTITTTSYDSETIK